MDRQKEEEEQGFIANNNRMDMDSSAVPTPQVQQIKLRANISKSFASRFFGAGYVAQKKWRMYACESQLVEDLQYA